ncbi:MAG: CotH kinase family protein, partial [Phycisphaerae bacterium]
EHGSEVLVEKGDAATYLVPTAGSFDPAWFQPTFNDGGWATGTTGLGFGLTPSGGTVTLIDRGSIWSYLDDGSDQGAAWRAPSFDDSAWAFGPAQLGYGDGDEATVVSYGPDSGSKHVTTYFRRAFNVTNAWSCTDLTVRVLRDDGAVMYLNGHELPRSNMPDGAIDYLTTTSNTSSETTFFEHSVDPTGMLVEGENVLAVEIHQSSRTSSDISFDLELVGETSTVGLLETDVEAEMLGANASILLRVPFTVNDPLEFTQLLLEVAYEDGYVAYLNGTPVAGSNAPEMPLWNSAALTDRPLLDAVQFESVDLTACIDLLVAGENVLAIHAMNDAASDATFLICPRLTALCDVMVTEGYYTTPTPGGPNVPGVVGLVADTKFSVDRGFYDAPFDVEITTDTDGAEIRYTLDGTAPTATGDTQYTGPITIATTTTLRAAAFKPGWLSSDVDTQTYIFLDDVLQQNGAGLPQYWGTYVYGTDAGQLRPANYDMSYDVVGDPRYAGTIRDDLRSIPSLSIVTDPGHLWNPSTGIYCNPLSEGVAWERPCSVELIGTDGSTEFQVNCGIRIHGGWGRRPSQNSKHSFRLLFKDEYGPTKLDYPLFADDDPDADDSFDTIVLRAGFNDQWRGGGTNVTYIQDPWAAKVQNLNGGYGPHGTWVHLYVNGLYWGLYNPVERPNADFAASYFGGSKEEYDAYRTGGLIDGDSAAWNQLLGLVRATPINYDAVQEILDVPNFIDYMVINQFGGNWDWPHNNWYASRHRVDGGKWYFHSWDAEGCLRDVNGNRVNNFGNNGPGEIYERLRQLPEFRLHYADRIHRLMFNDGLLTPSANIATLDSIVAEIDRAIVGESARWGDGRNNQVSPDRTRDGHWLPRINWLRGTYFPQRTSIVLSQFRSASLYPDTVAPTFNIDGSYQHGGAILAGDSLGIAAPNGTIYYTLDGTDPRVLGGGVSGDALVYSGAVTLSQSAHVK